MKDLSFFLLKNSLGAKMRKGYRSFCNGDDSTSILNQRKAGYGGSSMGVAAQSPVNSSYPHNAAASGETPPTLEEMILQLEFEEKMARNEKLDDYGETRRRMSCVNNSDILRSARNALNQYPRFSLDGKDAMYRSSFRTLPPTIGSALGRRKSICCDHGIRRGLDKDGGFSSGIEKTSSCLPPILAGERVVWCKPGVVAKLMGLEAMPIPVGSGNNFRREKVSSVMIKKQNLRKRAEKNEMGRRRIKVVMDVNVNNRGENGMKRGMMGSCSRTNGYCVMKPIKVEPASDGAGDALHAWKIKLLDPNSVLQSWDPTLSNPCTWFHVTCNSQNSVVRVDLGNAGLSGPLVPQLGILINLQYLEVFGNNINGPIPREIGNLSRLISLDLQYNQLSGVIPATLGNLKYLKYMSLNSNKLSGRIPAQVFHLIQWGNLRIMNVSDNYLAGSIHQHTNITGFAVTTIIQDPKSYK